MCIRDSNEGNDNALRQFGIKEGTLLGYQDTDGVRYVGTTNKDNVFLGYRKQDDKQADKELPKELPKGNNNNELNIYHALCIDNNYSCIDLKYSLFKENDITVYDPRKSILFPNSDYQVYDEAKTVRIGGKGQSVEGECIGDCQQYVTAFEQQHPEYFKATVFQNAIDANPCILQNAIFKSSNPQDYLDAEGFITDDRLVALTLEEKLKEGVWQKTVEAFASRIHMTLRRIIIPQQTSLSIITRSGGTN